MGAIVREMKYGDPIDLYYNAFFGPIGVDLSTTPSGFTNSTSQIGTYILSTHPGFRNGLNESYIGATLTFTSGTPTGALAGVSTTITGVSAVVLNNPAAPQAFMYGISIDPAPLIAAGGHSCSRRRVFYN